MEVYCNVLCNPLQTTHDSMGLVYDWVSELKFTVDKNLLDYLRDTHHIDVNPQNGEFTFDLECNINVKRLPRAARGGDKCEFNEGGLPRTRVHVPFVRSW